jgi:amino acid transporter
MPNLKEGAGKGSDVVSWVIRSALSPGLAEVLFAGIVLSQYLCGLAALTSASRMTYAFARDGGLPGSNWLTNVNPRNHSPRVAVWMAAVLAAVFTICVPYSTIAAISTVILYISYVIPVAAGFIAYRRTWTQFGPWQLGAWYRPLALVAVFGCLFLLYIGVQPPYDQAIWIVGGALVLLFVVWFGFERRRFKGPPQIIF